MSERERWSTADVDTWLARLLTAVLRVTVVVAAVLATVSTIAAVLAGDVVIIVASILPVVILAVITFHPRLSYPVRVIILLATFYLLGTFLLAVVGPVGSVLLVAFPAFGGLLLGLRAVANSLGIEAVTFVVLAVLVGADLLPEVGVTLDAGGVALALGTLAVAGVLGVAGGVLARQHDEALGFAHLANTSLSGLQQEVQRAHRDLDVETTGRHEAEEEVRRLSAALHEAREVILVLDTDQRIVHANPAFDVLRERLALDEPVVHLGQLGMAPDPRRAIRKGLDQDGAWAGTLDLPGVGGSRIELDARMTAVTDAGGDAVAYVVALFDVTLERRLWARLRRSRTLGTLEALPARIAEELETAIDSIHATVTTVVDRPAGSQDAPSVDSALRAVLAGSEHATALIHLLAGAAQRPDPDAEPAPIGPLIEEWVALLRAALPDHVQVVLALDASDDALIPPADLDRILDDLVTNAVRAMADVSDATLTIGTTIREVTTFDLIGYPRLIGPDRYLELSVTDTGRGIAPAQRDQLFDPLSTSRDPAAGHGLGLARVEEIVASLGGDVEVESRQGAGTSIRILLPTAKSPTDEVEEDDEPERAAPVDGASEEAPSELG